MVVQGWNWNLLCMTIPTLWLFIQGDGDNFDSRPLTFHTMIHHDQVCFEWFKQFTTAWPFQCLIISVMFGYRWGFWCLQWSPPQLVLESPVEENLAWHINIHLSNQDQVSLDRFKQFTAAWPFQCVILSMINGCTRLKLEFTLHNHHHTLTFESRMVTILIPHPLILFTPWSSVFRVTQAIYSSLTLPMSHHWYDIWLDEIEIGII